MISTIKASLNKRGQITPFSALYLTRKLVFVCENTPTMFAEQRGRSASWSVGLIGVALKPAALLGTVVACR